MCRISIIVPVYNTSGYLERCLDSIKKQMFVDFECIMVDDGSTDSSLSICRRYATLDTRFKVIAQENGGVSKARNRGLDEAVGDYVGFVDSDDWIDGNMYESMYRDAVETLCDIVVGGTFEYNKGRHKKILTSSNALMEMFNPKSHMYGFSVTRLIKREIIGNLRYDEGLKCYEDLDFFYRLYKKAGYIYWHDLPLYHYEKRSDSATADYFINSAKMDGIKKLDFLAENERDEKLKNRMKGFIDVWYLETSINYVSHRNTDSPDYQYLSSKVFDKRYLYLCTLRQRVWRYIILYPCARKVYWMLKRNTKEE